MLVRLVSLLIFASLREAQPRTSPDIPLCSLLLTHAEAACLSLLGSATAADSCLLSKLYGTGLLVYLVKCFLVDQAATATL